MVEIASSDPRIQLKLVRSEPRLSLHYERQVFSKQPEFPLEFLMVLDQKMEASQDIFLKGLSNSSRSQPILAEHFTDCFLKRSRPQIGEFFEF